MAADHAVAGLAVMVSLATPAGRSRRYSLAKLTSIAWTQLAGAWKRLGVVGQLIAATSSVPARLAAGSVGVTKWLTGPTLVPTWRFKMPPAIEVRFRYP